jgi:predicted nucleotidyltransferase component of viral defense system
VSRPRRLVHTSEELADLAEARAVPVDELEQDFLLVTVAEQLQHDFPGAVCFKGGFVLRHVHGQNRVSVDIDATRFDPPKNKLEADDVRRSINRAGRNLFSVRAAEPDSAQSLDFSRIQYTGPLGRGRIAVEVSYREAVILDPMPGLIGPPFFEPFVIPAMAPEEMAAEKLRTLAQRRRPTDLSDLAYLIDRVGIDDDVVRDVVPHKFKPGLVKPGSHEDVIRANIDRMRADYESTVPALAPGAPPYDDAAKLVLGRLGRLLP